MIKFLHLLQNETGKPLERKGLTTSRAFFVGDVNIFGMRLLIQIRYFFVNNRKTILTHWDCIYLYITNLYEQPHAKNIDVTHKERP